MKHVPFSFVDCSQRHENVLSDQIELAVFKDYKSSLFFSQVRVGSEDLKSVGDDAQRIPISNVITHPQYKRSVNYNDVAILKLSTPVREASNIRPICIQTKSLDSMAVQSNVTFIVIGWGATSFDEDGSIKLMKTPGLR